MRHSLRPRHLHGGPATSEAAALGQMGGGQRQHPPVRQKAEDVGRPDDPATCVPGRVRRPRSAGRRPEDAISQSHSMPLFRNGFCSHCLRGRRSALPSAQGISGATSRGGAGVPRWVASLGWIAQPAILALLLLLPIVARPAAVASIAVGIAAIAGAVVLSAAGGSQPPTGVAATLLVALLVMAYAVGFIGAISGRLPLPALSAPHRTERPRIPRFAWSVSPVRCERAPPPRPIRPLGRSPGIPARAARHGGRRVASHGGPGGAPPGRLNAGGIRDVPPPHRGRPRRAGRPAS